MQEYCVECGALLPKGSTCENIFGVFTTLKYLHEDYLQVHLPMVACFMIQHGRYSNEALAHAQVMLRTYLERPMTVPQLYQLAAQGMSNRDRTWKMNRSVDDPPLPKVSWSMTIIDVAQNSHEGQDMEQYCMLIKQWTRSTLEQMASLRL